LSSSLYPYLSPSSNNLRLTIDHPSSFSHFFINHQHIFEPGSPSARVSIQTESSGLETIALSTTSQVQEWHPVPLPLRASASSFTHHPLPFRLARLPSSRPALAATPAQETTQNAAGLQWERVSSVPETQPTHTSGGSVHWKRHQRFGSKRYV
jgi:hypothetical protein